MDKFKDALEELKMKVSEAHELVQDGCTSDDKAFSDASVAALRHAGTVAMPALLDQLQDMMDHNEELVSYLGRVGLAVLWTQAMPMLEGMMNAYQQSIDENLGLN